MITKTYCLCHQSLLCYLVLWCSAILYYVDCRQVLYYCTMWYGAEVILLFFQESWLEALKTRVALQGLNHVRCSLLFCGSCLIFIFVQLMKYGIQMGQALKKQSIVSIRPNFSFMPILDQNQNGYLPKQYENWIELKLYSGFSMPDPTRFHISLIVQK